LGPLRKAAPAGACYADLIDRGSLEFEQAARLLSYTGYYLNLNARARYAEAEPLLKRALEIREKALGPGHPDVAQSRNNLASLYHSQGKYAEAEPLFKRSLAIREKTLGPEHPSVATLLENYAVLLRKTNRETQAEELEARARAIRAKHAKQQYRIVPPGSWIVSKTPVTCKDTPEENGTRMTGVARFGEMLASCGQ